MNIKYWSGFSKRKNSTKQPTGGTDCAVVLKEDTSILQPTFIVSTIPDTVNYIQAFGRYYFVTDITRNINGSFELQCTVDELASYKSTIGSLYANVEYTSSSTNTDITDPRNKPTYVIDESVTDLFDLTNYGFKTALNTGHNVVGIVCDNGVRYFEMDDNDLQTLCGAVFNTSFIQQIENDFYDLKNIIVSCIKVPYEPAVRTGFPGGLVVGGQTLLSSAYLAKRNEHVLQGVTVNLTFPNGLDFSYLDLPPYTTGSIYLPYVGLVNLDLDIYAPDKKIIIDMYFDMATGDLVYRLSKTSGDYISTYSGNCAANVPISGSSYNAIGAVTAGLGAVGGIAQMAAGVASGNAAIALSGGASLVGSGVSAYESLKQHTQVNGSISSAIGSSVGSVGKSIIFTRRPTESDIDNGFKAVSGMPYFKGDTIGNLSGFVKCSGASISISGYDAERDAINSYLNSGFYYE